MKGREVNRQSWARSQWIVAVALATLAASTGYAEDKPWSRAHRGELYPILQMLSSDTVTAWDAVDKVELDGTPCFGAGMGFNFNDHLNLNTEMLFGSVGSTQSWILFPEVHEHMEIGAWLWNLNLDYNILKGRLTPLVTGGGGLIRFHEGGQRLSETHWTGNLGAGVRWDMTDAVALRIIYRWILTEQFENADDRFEFDGVSASLIFMFK